MTGPGVSELYDAIEATWPAAEYIELGPWTVRKGAGGGKRVSAATANRDIENGDIAVAEQAMARLDQPALFMLRDDEEPLDRSLATQGYEIIDPVSFYVCPIGILTGEPAQQPAVFGVWPPTDDMKVLWATGGIGAGRLQVMDRAVGPKTIIRAECDGRLAGCAFVANHQNISMIHAIEVLPEQRQKGIGINILRNAAHWAQNQGARYFSLVVTDANQPANGLYMKLGMSVMGGYHYRIRK